MARFIIGIDTGSHTGLAVWDSASERLVEVATQSNELPDFIVPTEEGYKYCIYDTDTPMMVKIKEFMALYCIVEITMRMLKVPELKKIMGFPEDYVLVGSQADQKKFIGNAVEVTIARAWCEALCEPLSRMNIKNIA